jgi:hypothetical protein
MAKTSVSGTFSNNFYIGDGLDVANKYVYVSNNVSPAPGLRYNETGNLWEYSDDGNVWNAFGTASGSISHNSLSGLQGGLGPDAYYHLNVTQHTWLIDGPNTGYWKATKGGTDQTAYSIGDILYANSTTTLTKLTLGLENKVLTSNGTIPYWADVDVPSGIHNDLSGIQGGITNQYYHFSSDGYTWLVDGPNSGYWKATKGGTDQVSYDIGDILYANSATTLTKLPLGLESKVLTSNGTIPYWANIDVPSSVHNDLTGLQGTIIGRQSNDGYYHLTYPEYTWYHDAYSVGKWMANKGGTGYKSYTTGDLLRGNDGGSLSLINIGSSGQVLTSDGSVPYWNDPVSGSGTQIDRTISTPSTWEAGTPTIGISNNTTKVFTVYSWIRRAADGYAVANCRNFAASAYNGVYFFVGYAQNVTTIPGSSSFGEVDPASSGDDVRFVINNSTGVITVQYYSTVASSVCRSTVFLY